MYLPTPLLHIKNQILIKAEINNLSGSHKFRAANYIITSAFESNLIDRGTTVIESTGGNFGLALLSSCLKYEIPLELVVGLNISQSKKNKLSCLGAKLVGQELLTLGLAPREVLQKIMKNNPEKKYYYTDQFQNWGSYLGQYQTGEEIVQQLKSLHPQIKQILFIGCAGTGASFMAISDALEDHGHGVKRILVEPVGCDSRNEIFREHRFEGMSVGLKAPFIDWDAIDEVYYADESHLWATKKEILRKTGYFVGNTSAACYSAALEFQKYTNKQSAVLTFFYDSGV